jgi:GNAT superfamily N-acetyltransferase
LSFVVFALPRCRTKWLSTFLSYADWQCGHDEVRHLRSLEDVASWFAQPCTGTVETAAAPFWRLLPDGVRVVTLRRPVDEVVASFARAGLTNADALRCTLMQIERKLDQIERRLPDVLRLTVGDLAIEEGCARVFEFCTGLLHDHGWWAYMAPANIQVSIPHMLRYFQAHAAQMQKLCRTARLETLRRLRRPVEMEGVTFQTERLDQAFSDPDGHRLMSEECVFLGEHPEAWRGMNIPLLAQLEDIGRLHIYTARSNGRMFGYLVAAVGESFYAADELEAEQVSYFADPSWPGLGRKLQRAAIDDLRARGVDRLLMFQPDGTRAGLVYRRLGAHQTGQRFLLELH